MGVTRLQRVFGPEPFSRLAYTHVVATAADAFVVVSLAGSLFFNVSVDAARPQLTFYLLLTLTPFALVIPFVGPAVDRHARAEPVFIAFTGQARAIVAMFLALDLKSLLLYPDAFALLVLGKAYSVAKSAIVPNLVAERELVAANARLARHGALAGAVGGGVAVAVQNLGGATQTLRIAAVLHLVGSALALRIPRRTVATRPSEATVDDRSGAVTPIAPATAAMGILRGSIGFTTFVVAFGLKQEGAPLALFGIVALAAALGYFVGAVVSPAIRRRLPRDDVVLVAALFAGAAGLAVAALVFGAPGQVLASFAIALAASAGRNAFDAVAQRLTPEGRRGHDFARFETIFQLAWVAGALVPVGFDLPAQTGLWIVSILLGAAAVVATFVQLAITERGAPKHTYGP